MGKRSIKVVLAVLVALAGFGLVAPAAPAGAVPPPAPKAFTITAAPVSSVWSQAVKLTASLTPKGGGAPKGGTITFLADGAPVGSVTATTRNTTLTTGALPPGDHAITASYSGDAVTAPATTTNGPLTSVAAAPVAITLKATQNPVPYEDRAEIKAVVLAASPAAKIRRPTGTVTFTSDTCISATINLNANGVATWRPWLCPGEHTITAVYNGSDQHAASDPSAPLELTVEDPEGSDEENVDEANEGEPADFLVVADDGETSSAYAQTITPSRTGRIYAVDLFGAAIPGPDEDETLPGPLLISIQTLDGDGVPTGSILGQGELDPSEVPGFGGPIHVDLDTQADVEGGVTYALVLEVAPQTPEANGAWILAATIEDDHPGTLEEKLDGGPWADYGDPTTDLYFRTHLGDPV
jgi:hypothetical protein